jgi:hypothetical protein
MEKVSGGVGQVTSNGGNISNILRVMEVSGTNPKSMFSWLLQIFPISVCGIPIDSMISLMEAFLFIG